MEVPEAVQRALVGQEEALTEMQMEVEESVRQMQRLGIEADVELAWLREHRP